jgi:hypothetical protein
MAVGSVFESGGQSIDPFWGGDLLMKKFLMSKKGLVLLVTMIAAVATAVGAYAYFTSTGTGTGSATVGADTAFTVNGDVTGNLYPAGPALTVPVTVTNNSTGSQKAGTVTLDSITSDAPTCNTSLNSAGSAFTFANPITINEDLATGATSTVHNGSLQMNDTGVNQDSCQGSALTLHFSEHNAA